MLQTRTSQVNSATFRSVQIVFHSEPFAQDLEVAGQMHLKLTVQADAPDFDLWAQVLMVLPDGSAVRLGEDIRRARFRDNAFRQELLKPDQVVEIPFEFYWMARRIPAGARLRFTIAPLNSPIYQRNYNTGGHTRTAVQRSIRNCRRRGYLLRVWPTGFAAQLQGSNSETFNLLRYRR